uniref:Soluble lytic murein transglycosylase and related regulatory proteins (Some contain lysm/invasin domains) n=1 Tax=uncultured alpha proteobacterium EB080_L06A09 TaxID=710794 RepID=E0Y0H9_9PROT|nr:soluble lytic murein transglycosylase and related regulatory proteins (some contain lysm/invasin domains) [uncultured alpha proteobacterium EB080_L06A09]
MIFILLCTSPIYAQSNPNDVLNLSKGLDAIESGNYTETNVHLKELKNPIAKKILKWAMLRSGHGDWKEYQNFLNDNPQWPGLKKLKKQAEIKIPENSNPQDILNFFGKQNPDTGFGALKLIKALIATNKRNRANKILYYSWSNLSLSLDEQKEFLSNELLTEFHHEDRINNLLWRGEVKGAKSILHLTSSQMQKLIKARIGLQIGASNVDQLIASVPNIYKDEPGLAFDRFQWRIRKNRWDDAENLLIDRTQISSSLGRPEKWAKRRRGFARRAMRANQPKLAYYLASNHQLTAGANYADLEWLSGYISLVYLDAPDQSLKHFENFNLVVSSQISKARAGYWLGKVNEKYGHLEQAAKDYKVSANFQMTYYGQLSSERLKLNNNQSFVNDESIFSWRTASFVDDSVFQAAVLLLKAEKFVMMRWFMTHMAETLDRDGLMRLSNYAHEKNVHFVEIGIAKEAAKRGIILPKAYFPINEIPTYSNNLPPEVILSIARRESELNMNAISPAGAVGLMQILPSTAKQMSKELGIKFSYKKLKSDAKYNVKLGSAYLSKLIDIYEGSYLLAFAAYNAGPRKVNEWIKLYGDPRDSLVSVINWVEHIPYKETRNYVMRVSESLHVYRIRINGSTPSISLTKDLK